MTIVRYKVFGITIFTKETMNALPTPGLEKAVQDALLRTIKSAGTYQPKAYVSPTEADKLT